MAKITNYEAPPDFISLSSSFSIPLKFYSFSVWEISFHTHKKQQVGYQFCMF